MLGNREFPEARSRLCVCQSLLPHDLCHRQSSSCWLLAHYGQPFIFLSVSRTSYMFFPLCQLASLGGVQIVTAESYSRKWVSLGEEMTSNRHDKIQWFLGTYLAWSFKSSEFGWWEKHHGRESKNEPFFLYWIFCSGHLEWRTLQENAHSAGV